MDPVWRKPLFKASLSACAVAGHQVVVVKETGPSLPHPAPGYLLSHMQGWGSTNGCEISLIVWFSFPNLGNKLGQAWAQGPGKEFSFLAKRGGKSSTFSFPIQCLS